MQLEFPEIRELKKEIAELKEMLTFLVTAVGEKSTVNITDIAKIEGVSVSQLRKGGSERYLLPRFGESGFPTGSTRWTLEEYTKWREKTPEERYFAYIAHERAELKKNANTSEDKMTAYQACIGKGGAR